MPEELDPDVLACNEAIRAALKKYDCVITMPSFITIPPLEIKSEAILPIVKLKRRAKEPDAQNP